MYIFPTLQVEDDGIYYIYTGKRDEMEKKDPLLRRVEISSSKSMGAFFSDRATTDSINIFRHTMGPKRYLI